MTAFDCPKDIAKHSFKAELITDDKSTEAEKDYVWFGIIGAPELYTVLFDPHCWVERNVVLPDGKPARLNDHFVIVFQNIPYKRDADIKAATVAVHGIHDTSVLTIRTYKGEVPGRLKAIRRELFKNPPKATESLLTYLGLSHSDYLTFSQAESSPEDREGFLSLPKDEHEKRRMEIKVVGEQIYGHCQLGKVRSIVTAHLFASAVDVYGYFQEMNKMDQFPIGVADKPMCAGEKLKFRKSKHKRVVDYVFQGKRSAQAVMLDTAVCNITKGEVAFKGSLDVQTDMVITKAYTGPNPPSGQPEDDAV